MEWIKSLIRRRSRYRANFDAMSLEQLAVEAGATEGVYGANGGVSGGKWKKRQHPDGQVELAVA